MTEAAKLYRPNTIDTDLIFEPGNLELGNAQYVSKHDGLVVIPCTDPGCKECRGFVGGIKIGEPTPVHLVLVYNPVSLTQKYIAHKQNIKPGFARYAILPDEKVVQVSAKGATTVSLGGIGNAGTASSALFSYKGTNILIDCGLTVGRLEEDVKPLPEEDIAIESENIDDGDTPIGNLYPDFALLKDTLGENKIDAIFITHPHLDHYGGLDEMLRRFPDPQTIYASIYGSAIITPYLWEKQKIFQDFKMPVIHRIHNNKDTEIGEVVIGSLLVRAIPVFHSVPGSFAYALSDKDHPEECLALFTGDFKSRLTEANDCLTMANLFSQIPAPEVVYCDGTNANRDGWTALEGDLQQSFIDIIRKGLKDPKGRIIVTLFSTHIARIMSIYRIFKKMYPEEAVGVLGPSFVPSLGALDRLNLTMSYRMENVGKCKLIFVAGCQANANSTAVRLSEGESIEGLRLRSTDTFVVSATPIPGRGRAVYRMISNARQLVDEVYIDENFPGRLYGFSKAKTHVSGHGSREDIRNVLAALPGFNWFMPIHCGAEQMLAAADIAAEFIPPDRIIITDHPITLVV